jgi:2,5-diamino-6-(ribosylamino)-4(3H)-pyrimidinone 5'-phosphate reductase
MVGVGTVLADDPSLTLDDEALITERTDRGESPHPARVVADSQVRTPPDAAVLDDCAASYLLVSEAAPADFVRKIEESGVTVIQAGDARVDLAAAFDDLAEHGIDQLLVEGGGEVIASLFEAGLVDRLSVFVGPTIIGGRDAPTLADGDGFVEEFPTLSLEDAEQLGEGVLLTYTVS